MKLKTSMKHVLFSMALLAALASSFSATAANRYWIAAAAANWNNTANWSTTSGGAGGASVPSTGDIANFDNNGPGNCSIPVSATISDLVLNAGYTGTITQSANPIIITGSATFAGGSFAGSSSSITFGGALTLSGTNFILPATLYLNGSALTYSAGTIDPLTNSSTVVFGGGMTITGSLTLNNVSFNNTTPWPMTVTLASATVLTIDGNMAMTGTQPLNFTGSMIDLMGNLSLGNTATGGGGSTVLTFDGTGNQAITGTPAIGQSALPTVNINKAGGTLTLPAMVSEGGSAWTYTSGTIDATTNNSTVAFVNGVTITGSHTLNNISFSNTTPWGMTYTIAAGTTLTAAGTVTTTGSQTQTFSGGTIDLLGNLSVVNTATGGGGTTVFAFTGTGSQAVTGSPALGQNALPAILINKASGTLTLNSMMSVAGSTWTYTAGTIDATTNLSTVVFDGNITISGSHSLYDIDFDNPTPWGMTYTLAAGTTLSAGGAVTLSGISGQTYSGGTLALLGNLNLTNTSTGDGGTTVFAFTGAGNQSITSSLPINEGSLPSVNINKASGTLSFPAILTMAGSNWTYAAGTMDVTTYNSTVVFGGNTTITGSHTLNNVTFNNATPWGTTLTFAAGTVLTVSGTLAMSGASAITLSGGTVNLLGGLNLGNTSTGDGGTTVLAFVGTGNQSITSSLPANENDLSSVNINKATGTLTFPAILTMAGSNWTYTTGTLDVITNSSTVYFGGNTTFTGSHTLNNVNFDNATPWGITYTLAAGTTLSIAGTTTMTGGASLTFNGGSIALQGNLNLTNTSTGDGGSTALIFSGTGNQAITSSLPVKENSLPSIVINKASGTLTFPAILSVAGNAWTYTAGSVDASTNASTVNFLNNAAINSNGMSFYNFSILGGTGTLGNNLTVTNNVSMSSPGVLNGGTNAINLFGNWSDWGSNGFTEATSTVIFAGAGLQTISVPGGETFANLTVNNSGMGIQLENNVSLSRTLTMTQGNIDLNTNTLSIGTSTANPGTLAYTAGAIVNTGSVTRWFKAGVIPVGSVSGLFPVGTTANGRPFSVSAPTAGPTAGGTITVSYTDGTTTTGVSFPDGAATVYMIKNLNWALSTGNGLAGGTYDLGISGTGYGLINSINDLRLTLVSSVVGTAGVNAGTTADPQVNRTGLTLANLSNTFYLGSINPTMTTLPIQLSSFTATPENGEVVLNWITAQEVNSDYFTVQRSADGSTWQDLEQVAAAGTSSTTIAYTADDRSPLAGVSFYRLVLADKDGGTSYSIVVEVNFSEPVSGISLFPNPAVNFINISFSTSGNYTLSMVNEIGQLVATNAVENTPTLVWNVSGLTPGIYFIQIRSQNGRSETKKVIIRR